MSRTKVKERIEMYAEISKMKEVKMHEFKVYYSSEEKLHFIFLKYTTIEGKLIENHKEIETFDGKGWLKLSQNFSDSDFLDLISELKISKFNTKCVRILNN